MPILSKPTSAPDSSNVLFGERTFLPRAPTVDFLRARPQKRDAQRQWQRGPTTRPCCAEKSS